MRTKIVAVTPARLGGMTYIAASVGFVVVFAWLAAHFGYPDVLDHPASEVLPKLAALAGTGRLVWIIYAVLPLLLIPAAAGAADTLGRDDGCNSADARLGLVLQTVAAVAMTLGLARWSTAQWVLAAAWPAADESQRVIITTIFDALNAYLGNGIGEFVGEFALYGSFLAFGSAMWRVGARRMAVFALITATFGLIGMFRNMTSVVQPASEVTNVLLPVFLIAFGAALVRTKAPTRE